MDDDVRIKNNTPSKVYTMSSILKCCTTTKLDRTILSCVTKAIQMNRTHYCVCFLVNPLMTTNLFRPNIRILRELRASMPFISEMWLSYKFRKTSCCRCDRCCILVIRLCWRLRSCSPSIMPSWGHSSRPRLEN